MITGVGREKGPNNSGAYHLTENSGWGVENGGSGGRGRGPGPPLFFDQNEARRAEKVFLETGPPS